MSTSGTTSHVSGNLLGLPRELDYIPEELQRRAKTELFEDEETKIHSLRLLRSMLKKEKGLAYLDEDWFLLAYLRARKFDVKHAFHLVKNFYTTMGKRSEIYYNFNFDDVRKTIKGNDFTLLPHRDEEGCAIVLIRVKNWDPYAIPLLDFTRAITSGLLHGIRSPATQIAGFKAIVDFSGFSLQLLPHITPTYIILYAQALQDVFPARFRAFHIVNENHLFSYIWVVLKRFLKKKLRDRFHFHGKDVKSLHDYFPPSILPAEYDGDLPPFDNSEWGAQMEESAECLTKIFSQGYEKYRIKAERKNSTDRRRSTDRRNSSDKKNTTDRRTSTDRTDSTEETEQ